MLKFAVEVFHVLGVGVPVVNERAVARSGPVVLGPEPCPNVAVVNVYSSGVGMTIPNVIVADALRFWAVTTVLNVPVVGYMPAGTTIEHPVDC
jgi:hypothetical protein